MDRTGETRVYINMKNLYLQNYAKIHSVTSKSPKVVTVSGVKFKGASSSGNPWNAKLLMSMFLDDIASCHAVPMTLTGVFTMLLDIPLATPVGETQFWISVP